MSFKSWAPEFEHDNYHDDNVDCNNDEHDNYYDDNDNCNIDDDDDFGYIEVFLLQVSE